MSDALQAALAISKGERPPKQSRNGNGQMKGGRGGKGNGQPSDSRQENGAEDSLLRDTLRLTLQSQSMLRTAFDASSLTILISKDEVKTQLSDLMNPWFENLPKRTEEQVRNRVFPEHPMKLQRKTLAISFLLDIMSKARETAQSAEEEPWATLARLVALPPDTWDAQLQDCKPKYRNPKEGRKWVWHLAFNALATPDLRASFAVLVQSSSKLSGSGLEVLQTITTQPQLEKELWKKLRV